jgi:hypothetical protein
MRWRNKEWLEPTMADRASLEILGFILGGVTAAVILTAAIVVRNNLDTKAGQDSFMAAPAVIAPQR